MTPTQNISEVLQDTKELLGSVRFNLVAVAANLVFLRENETRPWAEVLEDLDLSQGFASKLCSNYTTYVLEGGMAPERLAGIDQERLYLASRGEASVEEKFARATSLTRGELRLTASEENPHIGDFGEFCKTCWVSKENHG